MNDNIKSWIEIQNEPVKEMRKLDLKLASSKRIRDDSGLTMFSITGKQQSGKSSLALLILHELYEGDVEQIMNHVVFSIDEFATKIRNAIEGGYREKCIVWDDASVSGAASRWVVDPKSVMYLSALGDTLGIATKGLILTSPSGDTIKSFRNYAKYKILISMGKHRYDRIARGYWIGKSPMEQRWCSVEFEDAYDTRIPFYEVYAQKRKELSLSVVKSMEDFLKNGNTDTETTPTPESLIETYIIHKWKDGITNLTTIAKKTCNELGVDVNHQYVGRLLASKGLRVV